MFLRYDVSFENAEMEIHGNTWIKLHKGNKTIISFGVKYFLNTYMYYRTPIVLGQKDTPHE